MGVKPGSRTSINTLDIIKGGFSLILEKFSLYVLPFLVYFFSALMTQFARTLYTVTPNSRTSTLISTYVARLANSISGFMGVMGLNGVIAFTYSSLLNQVEFASVLIIIIILGSYVASILLSTFTNGIVVKITAEELRDQVSDLRTSVKYVFEVFVPLIITLTSSPH